MTMKRIFSSDGRVDETTPLQNLTVPSDSNSMEDRTSTNAFAALTRNYQPRHMRRPAAEQRDRTGVGNRQIRDHARGDARRGQPDGELSALHTMPPVTKNNAQDKSQHNNSFDPSTSFMSEPSGSEDEFETIASSQLDFQKKLVYRQKLRDFDAQSVGDTSLSSSNISTSPQTQRFRIQFDSSSDHLRKNIGKVRNKIKVASDRLSASRTSLDGRLAPSPPTRESSEGSNHKIGQVMSEDSQSSAESIRGACFTTEQSGGENTSSSDLQMSVTSNGPQNKYGSSEINLLNASPKNDVSTGSRRRGYHNLKTHTGDDVTNSFVYSGGDDDEINKGGLVGANQSRVLPGSGRVNPSSWSNDSSSPFARIETARSHCRMATWDGSNDARILSRTTPSSQPFLKSTTNPSLHESHDTRSNSAPINTRLPPYQHPDGRHYSYAPQNPYPEHDSCESDSAYGSSASCSSSSYTDSYERLADNIIGTRRSPEYRKVHFLPDNEATKFDTVIRHVGSVLDKPLFRVDKDGEEEDDLKKRPMFYCPNCRTKQRDIVNFATAAGSFDSPQTYLAFYFGLYLVASLFVFGLEEGWRPLDCVYFSVITLTTTGLGDFVPSSDGAKIVCACFIYVGVATIGLLLGSLLVGSLDKAHKKEAREAQIRDCPNCLRLEQMRLRSSMLNADFQNRIKLDEDGFTSIDENSETEELDNIGLDLVENDEELHATKTPSPAHRPSLNLTRHMSIDLKTDTTTLRKCFSEEDVPPSIDESTPFFGASPHRPSTEPHRGATHSMGIRSVDDSHSSSSSDTEFSIDSDKPVMTRASAAKYVFLTLKQALMNSLLVIAVGSVGYYYIEEMTAVDSFYFTTVLLTSVGYGDIVPVTTLGKLFTTFFSVVAGTVLLQNMTSIAMIPLELRKRRVEIAVLGQFGNQLSDDELRELSTGRLINRLKLATNRPYGLEECTREMFSLAMLVRLGRITEEDVKATFAAFRRLDVGNYGKLNSRTIIEGELMRRRSLRNLASLARPPDEWGSRPSRENMYLHQPAEFNIAHYNLPAQIPSHDRAPTPIPCGAFMHNGNSPESLIRKPSADSYYSQEALSRASTFDHDEYFRWASTFDLAYPPNDNGRNY